MVSATFGLIAFSTVAWFPDYPVAIALSVAWVGASGVAVYSIALELAAEITFPASENVSTGLLVVAGQIFSVIFIALSQYVWMPLQINVVSQCLSSSGSGSASGNSTPGDNDGPPRDYWPFNIFLSVTAILASCLMLLEPFSTGYQRTLMENALSSTPDAFGITLPCHALTCLILTHTHLYTS